MRNDFQIIVGLASSLRDDYVDPEHDPWAGSPFAWIKQRPSRQIGKIGEQLVAGWAASRGLDVIAAENSDADRIINGKRVEVKCSTLWQSGVYKFQQIRDQRYDYLVCLGLSPHAAHCWVIPKTYLVRHRFTLDGLGGQHTGKGATDTKWLSFDVARPPEWLGAFGGSLKDAMRLMKEM